MSTPRQTLHVPRQLPTSASLPCQPLAAACRKISQEAEQKASRSPSFKKAANSRDTWVARSSSWLARSSSSSCCSTRSPARGEEVSDSPATTAWNVQSPGCSRTDDSTTNHESSEGEAAELEEAIAAAEEAGVHGPELIAAKKQLSVLRKAEERSARAAERNQHVPIYKVVCTVRMNRNSMHTKLTAAGMNAIPCCCRNMLGAVVLQLIRSCMVAGSAGGWHLLHATPER